MTVNTDLIYDGKFSGLYEHYPTNNVLCCPTKGTCLSGTTAIEGSDFPSTLIRLKLDHIQDNFLDRQIYIFFDEVFTSDYMPSPVH